MGLVVTGLFISLSANAALFPRAGGFVYDDVLDITWTQDADINDVDTWDGQVAWAAGLSIADPLRSTTWDDWRLPTTTQPDSTCSDQTSDVPPQGFGTGCTGSEMGHLFNVDGINDNSPGLFTNVQSGIYWSGTAFAPDTNDAWDFNFVDGLQINDTKSDSSFAWAVRPGDVGVIPIPPTAWLLGSALGLLGWMRRRKTA
jgi:hypothetical protein